MQNASKVMKNNFQGIIFVVISCQRVVFSSPKVLDLDVCFSREKNPTMIRVPLLRGRVLSERALWRLLS